MKNKKQLMMGDINMGKETFEGKKTHCTIQQEKREI